MIIETKLGLADHVVSVIDHFRQYGFDSREALVERALQLLQEAVQKDRVLIESARLYAEQYEEDSEAKEWVAVTFNDSK